LVRIFTPTSQQIITICKKLEDPEPDFCTDNYGFKVIFRFPEYITPGKTSDKSELSDLNNLTSRQQEIFIILLSEPEALKTNTILEQMKEKISRNTLLRELNNLKNLGLIASRGKARKMEWFAVERKFNLIFK